MNARADQRIKVSELEEISIEISSEEKRKKELEKVSKTMTLMTISNSLITESKFQKEKRKNEMKKREKTTQGIMVKISHFG